MAKRGINKTILVGYLGKDAETRYMPNGNAVTNITMATSETWRDKQSGENQERTEWHRVVFFNRLAEIAGEYLKKGSLIYIEGQIRTRKWQDKEGNDRYTTEIVANEMQMLDSKGSNGDTQGGHIDSSGSMQPAPPQASSYATAKSGQPVQQPTQAALAAPLDPATFDDDIPF